MFFLLYRLFFVYRPKFFRYTLRERRFFHALWKLMHQGKKRLKCLPIVNVHLLVVSVRLRNGPFTKPVAFFVLAVFGSEYILFDRYQVRTYFSDSRFLFFRLGLFTLGMWQLWVDNIAGVGIFLNVAFAFFWNDIMLFCF